MRKHVWKMALLGLATALMLTGFAATHEVSARDEDGDIVIVVDAGHGSGDPGACQNGVVEETTNYQIAMSLKAELETYEGVKVYLTRGSAEYNSNSGRALMAKNLNADFVISCHNNSNGNSEPHGVEVYTSVCETNDMRGKTARMAALICEKVAACGLENRWYYAKADDTYNWMDNYTLIDEANRKAGVPGLIIEHAFLSNPNDAAFIGQKYNQNRVGAADAAAIAEYFGLVKRTTTTGSEITLTRTYSSKITDGTDGTYSSSNSDVAYVQDNGMITAISAGTATIRYQGSDGVEKSVSVTVPGVYLKAIAAATNPTFFADEGSLYNYNQSNIMVKGIYSDGSVTQLNGADIGSISYSGDAFGTYLVPISYNGYSCYLSMYVDTYLAQFGTPTGAGVSGANRSILMLPGSYAEISANGEIVPAPTEPATPTTQPATTQGAAEGTVAVTTVEETTEEITAEAETTATETTTVEETTQEETTILETTEAETEASTTVGPQDQNNQETKGNQSEITTKLPIPLIVIGCLIVLGIIGIALYFILTRRKMKKR